MAGKSYEQLFSEIQDWLIIFILMPMRLEFPNYFRIPNELIKSNLYFSY